MSEIPAQTLPGMKPWLCEYRKPDGIYAITLHGSDPEQVVEDNCDALPDLAVLGELHSTIPVSPDANPGTS